MRIGVFFMPLYTKESLEVLRQKIDLISVISSHVHLKKSGSAFKGLCPFHEEKTPSFIVQRGDSHYHCFGCNAHGDAIGFLMNYLNMSFLEAVESLAEKFGVILERQDKGETSGPSKSLLKEILHLSGRLYHFLLLYSQEGHVALKYLYKRGIDLEFIRKFEIGFAPSYRQTLYQFFKHKNISEEALQAAGVLLITEDGVRKDFFYDRIIFPIRNPMGSIIGFSGRKFKEETFGGKYVNTSETRLFKKSQVLFGLNYCRKTICREKKALIVEGQIDCLRLIHLGFDFAVAAQGTAFGEGHVKELLELGVRIIYLALDGDKAGQEAAIKIGDLFQKKGVEVYILRFSSHQDPDILLREKGPHWFADQIKGAKDYLTFLVEHFSSAGRNSPSEKNGLIQEITKKIQSWDHPVMIHESLKKLADLVQVPIDLLTQQMPKDTRVKQVAFLEKDAIDPDKILEGDFLRLLFFSSKAMPKFYSLAKKKIQPQDLKYPPCKNLYNLFLEEYEQGKIPDLLSCAASLESDAESEIITYMFQRKIDLDKVEHCFLLTLRSILNRNWMAKREEIKLQLLTVGLSEERALELAKEFDMLKHQAPQVDFN